MSNFNRRQFIKTSSAIAAASALPLPMGNIRTPGAQGNKVKVGVLHSLTRTNPTAEK